MKLTINATPKELAALISNLQEQPKSELKKIIEQHINKKRNEERSSGWV